jgi:hypothetical protein
MTNSSSGIVFMMSALVHRRPWRSGNLAMSNYYYFFRGKGMSLADSDWLQTAGSFNLAF